MKLQKNPTLVLCFALALAFIAFGSVYYFKSTPYEKEEQIADVPDLPVVPLEEAFPHVIPNGSTLFSVLRNLDIPGPTIQQIVDAAKPVQNLARLKSGIRFQIFYSNQTEPELVAVEFRFSALERLYIKKENNIWSAQKIEEQVDIKVISFSGVVTSSLWESAQRAKMDPDLIAELADIFGWEVDFSREVRLNDRWRITVEQKLVKGQPIGWGSILAAEYENAGTPYQAALFRVNGEDRGYFAPGGESLRKMFLKSPLRYGRITSHFSKRRFHPVLQTFRAHRGVDYGAPVGTPVRAVGDGTVTFAQYSGGGGKVIKVRHNATYQTAYKHLSGYAKGVRNGARVQQGQVIGYTGNTGMSTGPHLHFEFYQNGNYIDPLSKKFPSAEPVPQSQLAEFKAQASQLLSSLPAYTLEASIERETASEQKL